MKSLTELARATVEVGGEKYPLDDYPLSLIEDLRDECEDNVFSMILLLELAAVEPEYAPESYSELMEAYL